MRNKRVFVFMFSLASTLLITSGCAGPKMMSIHQGQTRVWMPFPKGASVSIESSSLAGSDIEQSTALRQALASKLVSRRVFTNTQVGGGAEKYPKLIVDVTSLNRAGWGPRAASGKSSSFYVEGKLISSDNFVLATISEKRSGPGGLIGAGGWATCGEDNMIKALRGWVIEDICKGLKQRASSEVSE